MKGWQGFVTKVIFITPEGEGESYDRHLFSYTISDRGYRIKGSAGDVQR